MEQIAYLPGLLPTNAGPLARFLPPIPRGVVSAWLSQHVPPGSWVLDPFGASPRTIVEAARAGYRVLVASNNPIDRFLIDLIANPPSEAELSSSLADLGSSLKGDQRLEPLLRSFYATPCPHCQREVSAQAFLWERGATAPAQRIISCPHCGESGEFPICQADEIKLTQLPAGQLHRARALERVTPLDDPDRGLVEEALDVYLPRAIYALFTLVNKLDSLPGPRRRTVSALLLAAFDQANTLWPVTTQRARPRQLSTPPHFRENNIWFALEEAVKSWTNAFPPTNDHLPVVVWPHPLPESGGISLFEGRLKDLADKWGGPPNQDSTGLPTYMPVRKPNETHSDITIQAVVAAIPRPNQAYWTLSALWAGWLWGREAATAFKVVLRRRRYDWNWHCAALQASFSSLIRMLNPGTPIFGLVGEAEPGFLSATLLSARLAGLTFTGLALRLAEDQLQLDWRWTNLEAMKPTTETIPYLPNKTRDISRHAGLEYLRQRGQPSSYLQIHAAALAEIVESDLFPHLWGAAGKTGEEPTPAELLSLVHNNFQQAFSYRNGFVRFHGSPNSLEVGLWWLRETTRQTAPPISVPPEQTPSGESVVRTSDSVETPVRSIDISLADRVEMEIIRRLVKQNELSLAELDQHLTSIFRGLFTPDLELVQICLESYAIQDPLESGHWKLRPQEQPRLRRADIGSVFSLLQSLGTRLGFTVSQPTDEQRWVVWKDATAETSYAFYPMASAVIGKVISLSDFPPQRSLLVYPGGRAALIRYKLQNDPRLKAYTDQGWRFIKFRHLRRLADSEQLNRQTLDDQLALDPMASQDPQISFI